MNNFITPAPALNAGANLIIFNDVAFRRCVSRS
jgi:hypothetical protein